MADNQDSGVNFITGLIIGAAVGIAIGFLCAPAPGKETRGLLKEKAEKAREKVYEATEKAKEAAAEA
jgi:gas vesicle protein